MKTIKKYFKVVFCFLAFAICSLFMAFAPTMTAVSASSAALTEYKNALSAISMKKSINASEGLKIPLLEDNIFNGATNKYTIIEWTFEYSFGNSSLIIESIKYILPNIIIA